LLLKNEASLRIKTHNKLQRYAQREVAKKNITGQAVRFFLANESDVFGAIPLHRTVVLACLKFPQNPAFWTFHTRVVSARGGWHPCNFGRNRSSLAVANELGFFSWPSRRKLSYSVTRCNLKNWLTAIKNVWRILDAFRQNFGRSWSSFFLPDDGFLTHPFQFTANEHRLMSRDRHRDSSVGIALSCGLDNRG
jgi:hypothetical protein